MIDIQRLKWVAVFDKQKHQRLSENVLGAICIDDGDVIEYNLGIWKTIQ